MSFIFSVSRASPRMQMHLPPILVWLPASMRSFLSRGIAATNSWAMPFHRSGINNQVLPWSRHGGFFVNGRLPIPIWLPSQPRRFILVTVEPSLSRRTLPTYSYTPAVHQSGIRFKSGQRNIPEAVGEAEEFEREGDVKFKQKDFEGAKYCYKDALTSLAGADKLELKGKIENAQFVKLKAQPLRKKAHCVFKLGDRLKLDGKKRAAEGNYKESLKDSKAAHELKPTCFKAIETGAKACYRLNLFIETITWCDKGLQLVYNDATLLSLKKNAERKFSETLKRTKIPGTVWPSVAYLIATIKNNDQEVIFNKRFETTPRKKHVEAKLLDDSEFVNIVAEHFGIEIILTINYSPCGDCADKLISFYEKEENKAKIQKFIIQFSSCYKTDTLKKNKDGLIKLDKAGITLLSMKEESWKEVGISEEFVGVEERDEKTERDLSLILPSKQQQGTAAVTGADTTAPDGGICD